MVSMLESFELTVSVPAEDWAYIQRRVKYLETLLVRIVRDTDKIREWFSAAELAAKSLPGLPPSAEAISRKASKERWRRRKGRIGAKWFHLYHASSLPARTFDALVSRILDLPEIDAEVPPLPDIPDAPPPPYMPPALTAPPWVLPLMRIMRNETEGDITEAWALLPERLPPNIDLPDVEDAARIIVAFGLLERGG